MILNVVLLRVWLLGIGLGGVVVKGGVVNCL